VLLMMVPAAGVARAAPAARISMQRASRAANPRATRPNAGRREAAPMFSTVNAQCHMLVRWFLVAVGDDSPLAALLFFRSALEAERAGEKAAVDAVFNCLESMAAKKNFRPWRTSGPVATA
jgi:hypothetical protein